MQRRAFLRWLGLGAAVVAAGVDVEQMLWTPGQRTHVLPPVGGWLSGLPKLPANAFEGMFNPPQAVLDSFRAPSWYDQAARNVLDNNIGLAMRFIAHYDIDAPRFAQRLDVIYGCAVIRPDTLVAVQANGEAMPVQAVHPEHILIVRPPERFNGLPT